MERSIDVISGVVPVLSVYMKDGNVSIFVAFCVCVVSSMRGSLVVSRKVLTCSERLLDLRCWTKVDSIDEEQEICFEFVKAGRCKIGQEGIYVTEMNWIRLCAISVKPVFSSWMSHVGVCCEHAPRKEESRARSLYRFQLRIVIFV